MKTGIYAICAIFAIPAVVRAEDGARVAADRDVEEVIVIGTRRTGDYSFITEDTEKLVETAGSLGDPLSAIFSLPGVVYPSGGQEPAVRGSSPSDNAYVVDFLPASYIFHDFGVSIFSEFILHDFQMYSAGFGPEHSGSTGALFDVRLREPENKTLTTTLDLSMLRSGIFLEGGVTENSAFYLSARRSLLDLFVKGEDLSEDGINFQDVPRDNDYQFKYTINVTDNTKLSLSANGAGDDAAAEITSEADFVRSNPDFAGDASLESKFNGRSALWEYLSDKGTEFTLGFGHLKDESNLYWGDDYVSEDEFVQNTWKARYSVPLMNQFRLSIGGERADKQIHYFIDQILFVCTEFDPSCDTSRRERIMVEGDFDVIEESYYVNGTWMPTDGFTLDLGVQQQKNDYTDEKFTHPRAAASLRVAENTRLTAKAGSYNRFPDINTVIEDIGNPDLDSPTSNHYTFGVLQDFHDGWSLSVEGYYKTLESLPLALGEDDVDADLLYANETEGEAYGVDIMLNKNITDDWYGWLSLSYGKSRRTNLRTDETVDYRLDTPLIANWVMNWQAKPRFNIGWRWSVRSGPAYTPIIGVQENPYFDDAVLPEYGEEFSDRLPVYNRLDVRMKWDMMVWGNESAVILDIINALNYKNVEERSLDYDKVASTNDEPITVDTVGLGLTPALTFRTTF